MPSRLDKALIQAFAEAQWVMGAYPGAMCTDSDDPARPGYLTNYSWPAAAVRQQLHVPPGAAWELAVMELAAHGLVIEEEGVVGIVARGILALATRYNVPYVRYSAATDATLTHHFNDVMATHAEEEEDEEDATDA